MRLGDGGAEAGDRRRKWVLRAPGSKRQNTEHSPRDQPPLESFCHRSLTVLWPTSFTLLIPQPPGALTTHVWDSLEETEARPLHVHSASFSHAFTTCQAPLGALFQHKTPSRAKRNDVVPLLFPAKSFLELGLCSQLPLLFPPSSVCYQLEEGTVGSTLSQSAHRWACQ